LTAIFSSTISKERVLRSDYNNADANAPLCYVIRTTQVLLM